ncbi:MAG: hypothetical protein H7840_04975 [Alphaproteobacteria bacterium]
MVNKADLTRLVIARALELVVEKGWSNVSLADIAARAEVPLSDLVDVLTCRYDLLYLYGREVDRRVLQGLDRVGGDSVREHLFFLLKKRLEALAPDKAALKAILRDSSGDLLVALGGLCSVSQSMAMMLEAAGVGVTGMAGTAQTAGLTAIYANTLRVWLNDDSPDMAQTMAALDTGLRRGESAAGFLWRGTGWRRDQPTGTTTAGQGQSG